MLKMSRIIKFAKVLRRNWKKSTFFFGVLAYGASYGIEKYKTFEMMRAYCEEAKTYGEKPLPQMTKPKHVTVILNPQANNGKANVRFEKFAAPLLYLAGLKVSVFQTEKEKQAQDLMEIMSNTDAVIVAGGNGTVHEVITGLMRRPDIEEAKLPLGIIPLGKTNTVAKHLFGSNVSSEAQLMAEAAMAVIRETTVALDVMKIQYASEEKPVFAMCSFEQGVFADIEPKVGKYWYLGFLKDKFVYFKNSFKERKPIQNSKLEYVAPCSGCSQCYVPPKIKKKLNENRWWSAFLPRHPHSQISDSTPDYSSIINEDCGKHLELKPSYSNITVCTAAVNETRRDTGGSLCIKVYPISLSTKQFISYGLRYHRSKLSDDSISTVVKARELIIQSAEEADSEDVMNVEKGSEHTDEYYYIDNEKYKRASCSISLLPKQVTLYG